jgi:hypothetical protein
VDRAVAWDQSQYELGELLLGVGDDNRTPVVSGVDRHAGRHLGGLAGSLAAHQRLAVLAVLGVDPNGPVLIDHQPARRIAADLGRRHGAPQRRPPDAGELRPCPRQLPYRRQLRG